MPRPPASPLESMKPLQLHHRQLMRPGEVEHAVKRKSIILSLCKMSRFWGETLPGVNPHPPDLPLHPILRAGRSYESPWEGVIRSTKRAVKHPLRFWQDPFL